LKAEALKKKITGSAKKPQPRESFLQHTDSPSAIHKGETMKMNDSKPVNRQTTSQFMLNLESS
jgi:hypothetical protein